MTVEGLVGVETAGLVDVGVGVGADGCVQPRTSNTMIRNILPMIGRINFDFNFSSFINFQMIVLLTSVDWSHKKGGLKL